MKEFVKSMIAEHKELNEKIKKLKLFVKIALNDKNIAKEEYSLACEQLTAMNQYSNVLEYRFNRFGVFIVDGQYFERVDVDLNKNGK